VLGPEEEREGRLVGERGEHGGLAGLLEDLGDREGFDHGRSIRVEGYLGVVFVFEYTPVRAKSKGLGCD
jgi:hypothetical protein